MEIYKKYYTENKEKNQKKNKNKKTETGENALSVDGGQEVYFTPVSSLARDVDSATMHTHTTRTDAAQDAISEKTEERGTENPFQRSSKILRSPVSAAQKEAENEQLIDCTKGETPVAENRAFLDMGEQIRLLVDMLEENGGKRRSIHQPMRDAIESIKALYELSAIQLRDENAKRVIRANCATQTTPGLVKRKREGAPNEDVQQRAKKRALDEVQAPIAPVNVVVEAEGQWTKVRKKKKKKKKKDAKKIAEEKVVIRPKKPENKARDRKRARPDAIVIEAKDKESYATILRSFKADPQMVDIGEAVSRIRRTQNGSMLLQLRGKEKRTAEFQSRISKALGQEAEVKALEQRVEVMVKDIDEITTKEEIIAAVKAQFEEDVPMEHIVLRKSFGGTQTAVIRLQLSGVVKLLKAGKIKIGWVICRIRERKTLTRCFRCLEYGHHAKQCRSTEDRSRCCRRCGTEGHIAKSCTKDPCCMLCRKDRPQDARHIAGSSSCPVFRRAMTKR